MQIAKNIHLFPKIKLNEKQISKNRRRLSWIYGGLAALNAIAFLYCHFLERGAGQIEQGLFAGAFTIAAIANHMRAKSMTFKSFLGHLGRRVICLFSG
ncbi:MAG: hypothetical protein ACREFX_08230 [Opitutaceae bacterium]